MVSDQIVGRAPLALMRFHPAIVTHEQARVTTCENGMRLRGIGDQRLDAAVERERGAMPHPGLSGI